MHSVDAYDPVGSLLADPIVVSSIRTLDFGRHLIACHRLRARDQRSIVALKLQKVAHLAMPSPCALDAARGLARRLPRTRVLRRSSVLATAASCSAALATPAAAAIAVAVGGAAWHTAPSPGAIAPFDNPCVQIAMPTATAPPILPTVCPRRCAKSCGCGAHIPMPKSYRAATILHPAHATGRHARRHAKLA